MRTKINDLVNLHGNKGIKLILNHQTHVKSLEILTDLYRNHHPPHDLLLKIVTF